MIHALGLRRRIRHDGLRTAPPHLVAALDITLYGDTRAWTVASRAASNIGSAPNGCRPARLNLLRGGGGELKCADDSTSQYLSA